MTDGPYTVTVDNRPDGKGTEVWHLGKKLSHGAARVFLLQAMEFLPADPPESFDTRARLA